MWFTKCVICYNLRTILEGYAEAVGGINCLHVQVKQVYGKLLQSKMERWDARKALLQSSIESLFKFIAALASLPGSGQPPDFTKWLDHLHKQARFLLVNEIA